MKINTITIIAPLLLFFCSCDPGSKTERILQNNTDKDIRIYFFHQSVYDYPKDTILAKANSKTQLFITSGIGGSPNPINPVNRIDSIHTSIDGAVLKKDMMNPDNWDNLIQKQKRSYNHFYTFTVNKEDIE